MIGAKVKSNGMWMTEVLDRAVRNGEGPYQANRKAVESIDIKNEIGEGRQHLMVMLEGLDLFITNLEEFENVSETVAKQASALAR
jgi:hypothetical protein